MVYLQGVDGLFTRGSWPIYMGLMAYSQGVNGLFTKG